MPSHPSLNELSDADLAALCLLHQRAAWEEFFKRFSPVLKKAIRSTFNRCGAGELGEDIDVIMDIHAEIVEKLYAKGSLRKCLVLSGLHAWLISVAVNQTFGWLRQRGRLKNLPQLQVEQLMRSLDAPFGADPDFTLRDAIEDEGAAFDVQVHEVLTRLYLESLLDALDKIKSSTNRWILRLSILGKLSLSEDEVEKLQSISPLPPDQLRLYVSEVEYSLAERERERQKDFGKIVLCWHQMRRCEAKIASLLYGAPSDSIPEIEKLKQESIDIERMRNELIVGCRSLLRPSNLEIACIVGIPEEKCDNVSQYLKRARTALRREMVACPGSS